MRRFITGLGCLLSIISMGVVAVAQDAPLVAQDTAIVPQVDIFGQNVLQAKGMLANEGDEAYADVSLQATVYDAEDEVIGEGFGYLVNACGAGLLPGFALQPGDAQAFAIPLELYDGNVEDAAIERVEVTAQGTAIDPVPRAAPPLTGGITKVSDLEVTLVEWIDEQTLRFGAGCRHDLFHRLNWREYNLRTGVQRTITHPNSERITEALRRQLGLLEDIYFNHSKLSFPPDARRMVYQNEINSFYSAEPDGSFKRLMLERMSTRTLQGITWLRNGAFLAYYYGATSDPVYYFTGNVEGRVLSELPDANPPSLITPGATPSGERIIFAAEQNGRTGYYIKRAAYPGADLLFMADVPGNNWPGPLVEQDADGATFIYAALPVDGEAQMVCFNYTTKELHELTMLPLKLASDERAWWWLSPDNNTIALAADGVNGGLWLIDLGKLPACE